MESNKKIMMFGLAITTIVVVSIWMNGFLGSSEKTVLHKEINTPILSVFASNENCSAVFWDGSDFGVKELRWLNDTTLLIAAYVSINCAFDIGSGSVKLENSTLKLEYEVIKYGDLFADCFCVQELTYIISNIDKEDYNAELVPINVQL